MLQSRYKSLGKGRVTQSQIRNNQNKIEATDYRYKDPPAALRSQDYMTSGNILISNTTGKLGADTINYSKSSPAIKSVSSTVIASKGEYKRTQQIQPHPMDKYTSICIRIIQEIG